MGLGRRSLGRYQSCHLLLHPISRFHQSGEKSLKQGLSACAVIVISYVKGNLPFFFSWFNILYSHSCLLSCKSSRSNIEINIEEPITFDQARWYIILILHTANNRILQCQLAKFRGLYLNEICQPATSCS